MRKLSDSPAARRARERKVAELRAQALARSAAPLAPAYGLNLGGIVHDPAECQPKPWQRVCIHIPTTYEGNDPAALAWVRVRKLWPRLDVRLQGGAGEKQVIVVHPVKGLLSSSTIGRGSTWDEAIDNAVAYARQKGNAP